MPLLFGALVLGMPIRDDAGEVAAGVPGRRARFGGIGLRSPARAAHVRRGSPV